ncbi:MAG: MotA/TolQ/ExbB proton channel family protein [Phycisphaerae bacterium]|nr:MotA/TolQ/ExbB proton channel family protein [Phycisphaerae bacterium]
MFTMRGAIPYLIVFLGFWSICIIFIKYCKIKVQEESLTIDIMPADDPGFIITPASVQQVLKKIHTEVEDPKEFILSRRINIALVNLKNIGNISDVDKILSTQADHDEAMVDSSYTALRGFIWAIPVLGFIGTVLGLSGALGSFGSVLSNANEMEQLRGALQNVTAGLSTAFETTLEGLIAALTVHMLMIAVQRREEKFLDECKDYCQKYIVSKLRLDSVG